VFGQLEWSLTDRLRVLPGLRFNYDQKQVTFDTEVYGGLHTADSALIALQRSILAPQSYDADVDDTNLSGQMTLAYQVALSMNTYATYATSFKSVGLNLAGVPTDASGAAILAAATVRPEDVRHLEIGLKTTPLPGITANVSAFNTEVRDYQAQVVNANVGVLRGYLANAERVRVRGLELDGTARVNRTLSFYGSAAYNDGTYLSFADAPPPLEDTGGPSIKDISGSALPGISKWALSFGGEYAQPRTVLGHAGEIFGAVDASYRSRYSSSASASKYLVIDGYSVINARLGFRWAEGWSVSLWARNLLDTEYFELLSAAPGNSGLYVGLPADPRTVGLTLRLSFGRN
jgi:iron complex outermembrane receptor protein